MRLVCLYSETVNVPGDLSYEVSDLLVNLVFEAGYNLLIGLDLFIPDGKLPLETLNILDDLVASLSIPLTTICQPVISGFLLSLVDIDTILKVFQL